MPDAARRTDPAIIQSPSLKGEILGMAASLKHGRSRVPHVSWNEMRVVSCMPGFRFQDAH